MSGNHWHANVYRLLAEAYKFDYCSKDERHRKIIEAIESWYHKRKSQAPLGVVIANEAKQRGIPVVFCTDTYHHAYSTQPVFQWAGKNGIEVVDCIPEGIHKIGHSEENAQKIGATKNWEFATKILLGKIQSGENAVKAMEG